MNILHRMILRFHTHRWGNSFSRDRITYRVCSVCGKQEAQLISVVKRRGAPAAVKVSWQ